MFLSCLPLYLDHEKSAISNTSFNQKFIKTQQGNYVRWFY